MLYERILILPKSQNTYAYQQLVQANADRVSTGMFNLLDRLQTIEVPGERVAAAAVLAILTAEHFGVCPHEAIVAARKIITASDHFTSGQQFDAARAYFKNEVPR